MKKEAISRCGHTTTSRAQPKIFGVNGVNERCKTHTKRVPAGNSYEVMPLCKKHLYSLVLQINVPTNIRTNGHVHSRNEIKTEKLLAAEYQINYLKNTSKFQSVQYNKVTEVIT